MFNEIDVDKNGVINKEELFPLLKKNSQLDDDESIRIQIEQIFSRIDINDKGFINYDQFISAS